MVEVELVVTAIVPAAGSGKRMERGFNKTFIPLLEHPILAHTVSVLASCPEIEHIIVIVGQEEVAYATAMLTKLKLKKSWKVVVGGRERQHSINNALGILPEETELVVVHDGARPLIEPEIISAAISAAYIHGAVGVAVPVKDTIKIVNEEGFINSTPDRSVLWAIQTPQVFRTALLQQAYAQAKKDGYLGTDDAALVERMGVSVKIVKGSYRNLKITTPEDLITAEALMSKGLEK